MNLRSRIGWGMVCVAAAWCLGGGIAITRAEPTATPSPEPADTPRFDIPRLDKIVIDGRADEWGEAGFRVETLAALDGAVRSCSDFDARFRLGWNDRGLLLLLTVQDNVFIESDAEDSLWQNDGVEVGS
jgi:hypothetical protein